MHTVFHNATKQEFEVFFESSDLSKMVDKITYDADPMAMLRAKNHAHAIASHLNGGMPVEVQEAIVAVASCLNTEKAFITSKIFEGLREAANGH